MKPSGVKCAVPSCDSKQKDGARLFKYSENYLNHGDWLKNCDILPMSKKRIFVCAKHFETNFFLKRKLKLTAVPTLFLPHKISQLTDTIELEVSENIDDVQCSMELQPTANECFKSDHSVKTYSLPKPQNDGDIFTLDDIMKMPDPYFDKSEINDTCVDCEIREKNVEVYRSLNRKLNLEINLLKTNKTQLLKKIKNLKKINRTLNKKVISLKLLNKKQ